MKSPILFLCAAFLGLDILAAEFQPLITTTGKLLLEEEFAGPALPSKWAPGGRPKSFSIVDGALQGVCAPDDAHGPSISVPIEGRNLTVEFAIKYATPGNFLFLVDGDSQFGGTAHLLRVALPANQIVIQQDRGALESKAAQKTERDAAVKAGQKAPVPSKEQLADLKFYRTERLAAQPRNLADGQWHRACVEFSGNEVAVQVDDGAPLRATGTVIDAKKARLVFLVGNAGTALIDHVKVWENAPRAEASAKK